MANKKRLAVWGLVALVLLIGVCLPNSTRQRDMAINDLFYKSYGIAIEQCDQRLDTFAFDFQTYVKAGGKTYFVAAGPEGFYKFVPFKLLVRPKFYARFEPVDDAEAKTLDAEISWRPCLL
jgi:hypothetical protein